MAFGTPATTPTKPRLVCLGTVEKVGEPKLTEKGVYFRLPIEIKGVGNGRDTRFGLLYAKHWLEPNFDPEKENDGTDAGRKRQIVYYNNIANKTGKAALQVLAGEKFDAMADHIQANSHSPTDVAQAIAGAIVGQAVGYVLKQGKDEDGDLTDFYEVQRFFAATEENIARQAKKNAKDYVVTWA